MQGEEEVKTDVDGQAFYENGRHSGVLPGIRRLEKLEADFPLTSTGPDNRELGLSTGLINSIGFDGNCCSLVLSRYN